jgi:hypothetical protein
MHVTLAVFIYYCFFGDSMRKSTNVRVIEPDVHNVLKNCVLILPTALSFGNLRKMIDSFWM